MKISIDTNARTLVRENESGSQTLPLYSDAAFEELSRLWVKVGWNQRYSYTFSWQGRPIIQLPEDMVRIQEVIYQVKPDVILETGVAHGGSLIYYASLCKTLGRGRVIGIDLEIRPHNRAAIEKHELASYIQLLEGDSTSDKIVSAAKSLVKPGETVLVLLDSCHTREHVAKELEAYHGMVSVGSYIVATDGIMFDLHDVPQGKPEWTTDNPATAAQDFAKKHPEFVLEQPAWPFNQSSLRHNITHWPSAYLRRVK